MKLKKCIIALFSVSIILSGCSSSRVTNDESNDIEVIDEEQISNEILNVKAEVQSRLDSYLIEYDTHTDPSRHERFSDLAIYLKVLYNVLNLEAPPLINSKERMEEATVEVESAIDSKTLEEKQQFIDTMNSPAATYYSILYAKFENIANVITADKFDATLDTFFNGVDNKITTEQINARGISYIEKFESDLTEFNDILVLFEDYKSGFTNEQIQLIEEYSTLLNESQLNNIEIIKAASAQGNGNSNHLLDVMEDQYRQIKELQMDIESEFSFFKEKA